MDVSRVGLLRSSSEESFEHIDADFDSTYFPELRGEAVADFTPLEKGQVMMRRGDSLVIREQTLDQKHFIVTNLRTRTQGRVPSQLIKFVTEEASMEETGELIHILHSDLQQGRGHIPPGSKIDYGDGDSGSSDLDQGGVRRPRRARRAGNDNEDGEIKASTLIRKGGLKARGNRAAVAVEDDETESDLDQGSQGRRIPGKKSGKMAIVRRKGVSKSKGSPYRSSGSSHDEDSCPLQSSQGACEHRTGATPPVDADPASSDLVASALVRSSPKVTASDYSKKRSLTLDDFEPYPPVEVTKEERTQAVAAIATLPGDLQPEYRRIEKYNILSVSGADRDGRPVIVFSACRLPPSYQISHDRLKEYFMLTLDQYVEQDYTLLYFHHGFSSSNKPSFSWLRQIYHELDRKYKKNLKKVYIVHPTNFIRMLMILFKPFISYKFGRKLTYINRLEELRPVLFLEQVDIPEQVKKYDAQLMSQIRSSVAKTDSRSMFHVSAAAPTNTTDNVHSDSSRRQFGVSLSILEERENGELPLVVRKCTEYLEQEGLEVIGIFRRAPNNVKVKAIKKRLDEGEEVDMFENADPHMAAVLIKMFLRELPEPLLTFESYNKVMGIRGQNEDVKLRICREVIGNLPKANYNLLRYLMEFIDKVMAHEEANKMNALNLAIVFGPNMLWSTDQAASLVGLGEINSFVHMMILNKNAIFT